jgi:hypothetical protein
MGQGLISLGILLLLLSVGHALVFLTSEEENLIRRLRESVWPKNSREIRLVFGHQVLRIAGIFWIFMGFLMSIVGEHRFQGKFVVPLMAIIVLMPLLIGVFLADRR